MLVLLVKRLGNTTVIKRTMHEPVLANTEKYIMMSTYLVGYPMRTIAYAMSMKNRAIPNETHVGSLLESHAIPQTKELAVNC